MYDIEPLPIKPDRVRVTRRSKYPFHELTVGMSFTVPAECADQFRHVRVAASQFSKRNGIKLHCNVQANGTLIVWRDKGSTDNLPQNRPSQFELINYLASMQSGQSFTLGSDYSARFEQLTDWVQEYAAEAKIDFSVEDIEGNMKVTRKAGG